MVLVSNCLTILQKWCVCQSSAINKTHIQMTFQCCFGMCKSQPSPCVSPCSLTSCTRGHCSLCKTAARTPPLPPSMCLFYCSFLLPLVLQLTPAFLLASISFSPTLPLTIFPSLGRPIVLLSSSQRGMRVHKVSSRCHMWNSGSSCRLSLHPLLPL